MSDLDAIIPVVIREEVRRPSHEREVWVFLIERGVDAGSDLQLFWNEADAMEAVREHLTRTRSDVELRTQDQVYEAIESTNHTPGNEEYIVMAPFPVTGAGEALLAADPDDLPR